MERIRLRSALLSGGPARPSKPLVVLLSLRGFQVCRRLMRRVWRSTTLSGPWTTGKGQLFISELVVMNPRQPRLLLSRAAGGEHLSCLVTRKALLWLRRRMERMAAVVEEEDVGIGFLEEGLDTSESTTLAFLLFRELTPGY